MMRRLVTAICVAALVTGPITAAVGGSGTGDLSLRRQWIQWAFGDSGAPLLDPELC